MRYGGGLRAVAALLLIGFIALVGAGAYGAGFAAGSASPTVVAPSPAWAYGGAFGIGHVIGFLVTILILIVMIRLIMVVLFGHRHHGWARHSYWHGEGETFGPGGSGDPGSFGPGSSGGPGSYGPRAWGGWHRSEWREAGQARFDEFHNQSHGYQPPAGGPATGSPATGSPATGGPATDGPTADQPR